MTRSGKVVIVSEAELRGFISELGFSAEAESHS